MGYNGGYSPAMELSYSTSSNDSTQTATSYANFSSEYPTVYPLVGDSTINAAQVPFEQYYDVDTSGQYGDIQHWNDLNNLDSADYMHSYLPTDPQTGLENDMHNYWNQDFDGNVASSYPPSASEPPESDKRAKPFECSCGRGFTRSADLKRHQSTVHYPVFQNCPVAKCARKGKNGFPRKDHLNEHLRSYHHINIAKREMSKRKSPKEDC